MDAGKFDQRVTIQRRVTTQDEYGQEVVEWADLAHPWAQAAPQRGREYVAAGQAQAEVPVIFRIWWRAGIDQTMRVLWRGQPHDITAVIDPQGARRMLELVCVAGVRDGR